jgi:hypothetical protein
MYFATGQRHWISNEQSRSAACQDVTCRGARLAGFEDRPRKVFDLILPLNQVAEDCRAMGERRAITSLLLPSEENLVD